MLTTTDDDAFMDILDPGDLLVFTGPSPADRLLQWVDGSNYNHIGIWLGPIRDGEDETRIEINQTIHAGLSARTLTQVEYDFLFGDGAGRRPHARKHGTVWMIPLDVLLNFSNVNEVGGGLRFDAVTALRWNRVSTTFGDDGSEILSERPYDVDAIRDWATEFLKKTEKDYDGNEVPIDPLLFDFGHLLDMARFWIDRAYRDMGSDGLAATVTTKLFESMEAELIKQRDLLIANYPDDAQVTTCSRFAYDALTATGHDVDIPVSPALPDHFAEETDEARTRFWVTPGDFTKSPDFTPVAHWVRRPESESPFPDFG